MCKQPRPICRVRRNPIAVHSFYIGDSPIRRVAVGTCTGGFAIAHDKYGRQRCRRAVRFPFTNHSAKEEMRQTGDPKPPNVPVLPHDYALPPFFVVHPSQAGPITYEDSHTEYAFITRDLISLFNQAGCALQRQYGAIYPHLARVLITLLLRMHTRKMLYDYT
jgi:hypothetical protein